MKIRDTVVYGSICREFGDTRIVHHVEEAATVLLKAFKKCFHPKMFPFFHWNPYSSIFPIFEFSRLKQIEDSCKTRLWRWFYNTEQSSNGEKQSNLNSIKLTCRKNREEFVNWQRGCQFGSNCRQLSLNRTLQRTNAAAKTVKQLLLRDQSKALKFGTFYRQNIKSLLWPLPVTRNSV